MNYTISTEKLDFDLTDKRSLGEELIPRLTRIREAQPVFWSDAQRGWFVTRYADVMRAFEGKLPLSSNRLGKVAFAAIPEEEWPSRIPLLTGAAPNFSNMTDPPDHGRLRKPLNLVFSKAKVEVLRDYVRTCIAELLDRADKMGRLEFIETISRPLTGNVIMRLMGMPDEYAAKLGGWANAIVSALGSLRPSVAVLESGEAAMREMDRAFEEQLALRRDCPTGDLLSVLAQVCEGDHAWTRGEFLGTCVNLLLAGHESTAATAAFGVDALASRPKQIDYLLTHRERATEMVEEISRYVAMSASQTRVASADFDWHGQHVKTGDVIYLWIASANRDPRVFTRPDELDLSCDKRDNLVFGRGIHHCVGHFLAKLELGELLPSLFERFDVKVLDDPLDFSGGYAFRTLSTLNVSVSRKQ
jgi:cytochrome P450